MTLSFCAPTRRPAVPADGTGHPSSPHPPRQSTPAKLDPGLRCALEEPTCSTCPGHLKVGAWTALLATVTDPDPSDPTMGRHRLEDSDKAALRAPHALPVHMGCVTASHAPPAPAQPPTTRHPMRNLSPASIRGAHGWLRPMAAHLRGGHGGESGDSDSAFRVASISTAPLWAADVL